MSKENVVYCDKPQANAEGCENPFTPLLKLRYLGEPHIAVRGTFTRNLYHFSGFTPVQTVDIRDARYLLASKLFGIAQ
jgi:hypothetical protein